MIRVSLGTAIELGLVNKKSDIPPTTAYIMIGDKCNNKCAFCSQSTDSSARKDKLSRVTWPQYSKEEILNSFKNYKEKNIKRICIQSMASDDAHETVGEFISYIKDKISMPISLSAKLEKKEDIERFFSCGVDKIGIAIDAANKELYENVKGNNYEEKLKLITSMARKYEGKISTHIIVGLGESHKDIYDLYTYLKENNVTISLFAFTPVRGTKMEKVSQPNIESYRRVQLMTYMIDKGYTGDEFTFKDGYIENVNIDDEIKKDIENGYPFEIRGCKNCNRPYYNERPGSTIYNYSRRLREEEIQLAIKEINLGGE
ncbi:radical SAM protein [Romboutsia sp.]|uniref:radical SAM protein n=1 Tax=Romboutsia sp. TaxID=1965302 RepID=UPI002C830FF8|nr:radical SAM protein [Romboutsia sp.]HSQ87701.1 radical SAM protein [Romboutsia sp.]